VPGSTRRRRSTTPTPARCASPPRRPSSSGWKPADVEPNEGIYRCETETVNLKGDYTQPTTMADVNMSIDQLK
jgi:hypothetical protein